MTTNTTTITTTPRQPWRQVVNLADAAAIEAEVAAMARDHFAHIAALRPLIGDDHYLELSDGASNLVAALRALFARRVADVAAQMLNIGEVGTLHLLASDDGEGNVGDA
jgi:hypothetical protein